MSAPELVERVPMAPHNLEAEESVLGAVLLDPELIHALVTLLRPEDFFLEKHRWIWEAYLALYDRREAIDPVTVADELERQGRLQELGGRGFLIGLAARVPTTVHAIDYARLVERDAIRRRLLEAATQIARMAYEEPSGEIDELLDRAEAALFAVAQRRLIRDVQSIRDLLRTYYEHIEYLYEHRGEPLGIPTGFRDLDRLLGGLQRSDLVIVAARPGVGKTSLLLSFALNAAKRYRQRVAIFSMEMSAEQVVHRLVTQETGIEGQRLRLGELREDEWPRFVHAVSTLSELPIWIDDTPAISAMQLRAKARRLYAEHGLDLLIVDYLQLMTADIRAENRVQEISYISRALKSLSRELNIPLVAASQLSRAVEQRHDKRPILADLRESGCLAGDTLIPIADTGERVPIRELVGREPFTVWALNLETWRLERAWVSRVFPTGRKPIYRLTTRSGRAIRATANHRFLTPVGWKRLDELQPGTFIALPRQIPAPDPQTMSDEGLALLDHPIGNGRALPRHAVQYMARDEASTDLVTELARSVLGDQAARESMTRSGISSRLLLSGIDDSHDEKKIFKQNVSWNRALRLARAVQFEKSARLAQSDVYWDSVASIDPEGIEDVLDMTVPGLHNFVANDVIVHNSIEQDSDVVIFIYRDEIYNQNTDRKNIVEIIVAKHRNGPIGTVELYFRPQQAQFVDLHKQEIRL
jgi:replicative DNA helicase